MKMANLALRFFLELAALAALAYWGFHVGDSLPMKLLLGLGAPVVAALVWGAFVAPKAWRPLSEPARLLVEGLVFGAALVALVMAGQPTWAVVFAVVLGINEALLRVWRQV